MIKLEVSPKGTQALPTVEDPNPHLRRELNPSIFDGNIEENGGLRGRDRQQCPSNRKRLFRLNHWRCQ